MSSDSNHTNDEQTPPTQAEAARHDRPYARQDSAGNYYDANAGDPPAAQASDPGDDDWRNPHIVRRRDALEAREREAQGLLMRLPYTGGFARVRILYVADKASLGWVPGHLQATLARMINAVEGGKASKIVSDTEAFTRAVKQVGDANDLADAFCVRGFLDPLLVPHEQYLDPARDDQMVVTDLHINERMGYLEKCLMEGEDVTILDPFLGRPVQDVPRQPRHQAPAATIGVSGVRPARQS